MSRVAVLGAGFQGVCVALELACRGVDVDLYDRHDACITQAGVRNEGKIHLGFVYSNEPSLETATLLARGALRFDQALARWLDGGLAAVGLSTPHYYAVHRDSLLPPAGVLAHFSRVRDVVRAIGRADGGTYLGQDPRTIAFELESPGEVYEADEIVAVVRTDERSVDVKALAALLRARVAAEPRIRFHPRTEIVGAARDGRAIAIALTNGHGRERRRYQQTVNCLWEGKLVIDRDLQFMPPYPSIFRLKYGIDLVLADPGWRVPCTTFVVGSFGDIVQIDERRLYLSWYPVARRGVSTGLTPPAGARELHGEEARQMIDLTLEAFGRLVRPMRDLHPGSFAEASVMGGIIVAAGETDIHDPFSRLHSRTSVGIRSSDGYHSVDTGKYTLAPMYAIEAANRICGVP